MLIPSNTPPKKLVKTVPPGKLSRKPTSSANRRKGQEWDQFIGEDVPERRKPSKNQPLTP